MIAPFRVIQPEILIEKDGKYTDVKAYCSNVMIDYGDVSGAGTQANDGCPANASVIIKNDDLNNFNPLVQTSAWNKAGGVGAFAPFLWNNKNIKIRANASSTTYATEIIEGNGSNIYTPKVSNIVPFSVTIKSVLGVSPLMSDLWSYTFLDDYLGRVLGTYKFSELYATGGIMAGCGVNFTNGKFNFGKVIPHGVVVEVQYLTSDYNLTTIFEGVLGDDISPSHSQVSLQTRDKTKILTDTIIDSSKLREYVASGTSLSPIYTDSVTSIAYNNGVPIEVYIQNLLNDMLGAGNMPLYVPTSPLYILYPSNDILQYQTLWEAINGVVSSIGWYIGFRYVNESSGYTLTLIEPDRSKTIVDFALTHTDDIYTAQGKLDFSSIRNKITVRYVDIEGDSQEIIVSDATSISNYGERLLVIEAENTKGITKSADATNMGNAILSDLKDARIYTQIEMPFFPNVQPFSTISLSYPKLSSTVDFYAVESVRHELDFEGNRYRTFLNCNKSVTGGKSRWERIASRPGSYRPVTANKLTEAYSYKPPTNLTVTGTAIIFSGTSVNVQADISFIKPILDNPSCYELQYKKNAASWDNAVKLITKDTKFKVALDDSTQYNFRVSSVAKNGDRGVWSSIVNFTPSTSTLYVTDADLSGERDNTLYIKTQAQFDLWLNDVCNVTSYTPDYSRVVICEGTYEAGTAGARKTSIDINKLSFAIEGRGNPTINFYIVTVTSLIITNADDLKITGINWNIYGINNFFLTINKPTNTTYPVFYKIAENSIIAKTGDLGFVATTATDFSHSLLQISDNTIVMKYMSFYLQSGLMDLFILENNKITLTQTGVNGLKFYNCKNLYVQNNVFTGAIESDFMNFDNVTAGNINNNVIKITQAPTSFNRIMNFDTLAYKSWNITKNIVVFTVDKGTNAGLYIPFVNSNQNLIAFKVTENVCQDDYPNWIDVFGGSAVTVTSGSPNLTKLDATFTTLTVGQKVRVNNQIRTIQTIVSNTSLTVDTSWTTSETARAYFEKASIQTWLTGGTGSKNNLVINNINDSY